MFSVYVLVFEVIIIIFFAAFVRIKDFTLDYLEYFTGSLVLLFGILVR